MEGTQKVLCVSDGGEDWKQKESLQAEDLTFMHALVQQMFAQCLLEAEPGPR